MPDYHLPVLLPEVVKYLITDKTGVYVDGTVGGGGHALGIVQELKGSARFIGIDRDREAIDQAGHALKDFGIVSLHQQNFDDFAAVLELLKINEIDGLLLDLGISSHQIDAPGRGFSYRQDAFLDMRMNQQGNKTAADLLNTLSEKELADIFYQYGEEKKSRQIARRIITERAGTPVLRSAQLCKIIDRVIPARFAIKSYARIFQSLRIAVNNELQSLERALEDGQRLIKRGGRCVIISYHSLEDRIVKQFFRKQANPCTCPPEWPQCVCGKTATFKILTPRPVTALASEVITNIRARSARLRAGEKL